MSGICAVAVAALVLLPACGGDDAVTDVAGIPVLEGHTKGAGTELGDGFSVVEGSVLLGDVMPPRAVYGPDQPAREGWRAVLLVTGDAEAVVEAYGRQAAAIGLPLTPPYATGLCARDRREVTTCEAESEEGAPDHGRRVALSLQRSVAAADRAPLSHLLISYTGTGAPPYPPPAAQPCGCRLGPVDAGLPGEWPSLPTAGEPYEASLPNQEAMEVEPGSRLVAHPGAPSGLWSAALLVVTGDPEEVLDGYEDQHGSYDRFEETRAEGDAQFLHRFWGYGGGTYTADAVVRPGRSTYLLIEHSSTD